MKQVLTVLLLGVLIWSCKPGAPAVGADFDLTGYTVENAGASGGLASKRDEGGKLLEQGSIINGKKNGAWMTFHDNGIIKKVSNYIDGLESGSRLEFSNRGQLEKRTGLLNNQLHGEFAELKFGRPVKTASYNLGELDGEYKEYFKNSENVQKLVTFKNGVQDGPMKYFDEEGNVTLEYMYKNGEKVSGGM